MPRVTSGLAFIYSGGQGTVGPSSSLGGVASTAPQRYVASQYYTYSTIPGITITHAARNAVGLGTLTYYAGTKTVTWLTATGFTDTVGFIGDGFYTVGYLGGFLRLYVDFALLPVSDQSQSIAIAPLDNSVFGQPTEAEALSGMTEYKCLYLVNETTEPISSVVLTLTESATHSDIAIGSVFDPVSRYSTPSSVLNSFALMSHLTGTPPVVRGVDSQTYREGLSQLGSAGFPYFPYFPSDVVNSSNGIDEFIPPLLADKYDSTNLLGNVVWGTTLSWPYIPSGRMVSMYFRRIMPPNPPLATNESMSVDMLVTLT